MASKKVNPDSDFSSQDDIYKIARTLGISPESPDLLIKIREAVENLLDGKTGAEMDNARFRMEVGMSAHDVNGKLIPLYEFADIYADLLGPNDKKIFQEAIDSARAINYRLMHLSKDGATPIQNETAETDLAQFMASSVECYRRTKCHVEFNVDAEDGCSAVINPEQIRLAMDNLLSNSIKAGAKQIDIKIKRVFIDEDNKPYNAITDGAYIEISVKDNGFGIKKDIRERIFEPFVTGDPEKGTGLGLSSVKKQVEAHGGHVLCDSRTGIGSFTEFTLLIPDKKQRIAEVEIAKDKTKGSEIKSSMPPDPVIVVDDEQPILKLIDRHITSGGGQCKMAASADEGLELIESAPKNSVVILDGDLKGSRINGEKLARHIKKERPDIIIIFSSGSDFDSQQTLLDTGVVNDILPKPYDLRELMDRLNFIGAQQNQVRFGCN